MKQPSRDELKELMGQDDSQWETGKQLQSLLHILHEQRELDINEKRGAYVHAAIEMCLWTFGTGFGPYYDTKRKCLWHLGWKVSSSRAQTINLSVTDSPQGPKEPEDPTPDVQATYHISQRGPYLSVYWDPKGLPSKRITKFNMLEPKDRQAFVDVRHLVTSAVEKRYLPRQRGALPKHRDLYRVQKTRW